VDQALGVSDRHWFGAELGAVEQDRGSQQSCVHRFCGFEWHQ